MSNNRGLYLKVLHDFYRDYKSLELDELSLEEKARTVHTIKGLSGNIGAVTLHKLSVELEANDTEETNGRFKEELKKVLAELKGIGLPVEAKSNRMPISNEERDRILRRLKEAISTKRIKKIRPLLEEIETFDLAERYSQMIISVKAFIERRDYKGALRVLDYEE